MTRLGQMLMDEGMEKGIELKETDSIKKLMKNIYPRHLNNCVLRSRYFQ